MMNAPRRGDNPLVVPCRAPRGVAREERGASRLQPRIRHAGKTGGESTRYLNECQVKIAGLLGRSWRRMTKRRPDQVSSIAQTLLSTSPASRPTARITSSVKSVATPDAFFG